MSSSSPCAILTKETRLIWEPNGDQAIKDLAALSIQPDYIFIDINMPRISGWECLDKIRRIPQFGSTPIAMYSTSASQSIRMNESYAGLVSVCIDKKSTVSELSTVLREFLTATGKERRRASGFQSHRSG